MSLLIKLYPDEYRYFHEISKRDFKGILDAIVYVDEAHSRSEVKIGYRNGNVFEQKLYADLDAFSKPMIDDIVKKLKVG